MRSSLLGNAVALFCDVGFLYVWIVRRSLDLLRHLTKLKDKLKMDSEIEFSGAQNSTEWVESLTDFNREDWSSLDNLVERSIRLSKRFLSKRENDDFFHDLVTNFY